MRNGIGLFASDATVDGDSQGWVQLGSSDCGHLARDPFATSFVVFSTLFPPPESDQLRCLLYKLYLT